MTNINLLEKFLTLNGKKNEDFRIKIWNSNPMERFQIAIF